MSSALIAAVLAINAIVIIVVVLVLLESKKQEEKQAATITSNLTLLLDKTVSASASNINLALLSIVAELERELESHPGLDRAKTEAMLAKQQSWLNTPVEFRVTDASGSVRYGPGVVPGSSATYADRDFFAAHAGKRDSGLIVSNLILGKVTKAWTISFSRRYQQRDGSFAGIVSAGLPASRFNKMLAGVDLGPHGVALLRDTTSALIARYPPVDAPTQQVGTRSFSKELAGIIASGVDAATYHTLQAGDGVERINSYRRLSAVPFHLVAGMGSQDYLESWRRWVGQAIVFTLVFLVVTVLGARLLWLSTRRLTKEVEHTRLLMRSASDGIHILDAQGRLIEASDSFCRMLGYSPAEMAGMNLAQWSEEESLARLKKMMAREQPSEQTLLLETRHRRKDGSTLDVEISTYALSIDGEPALFCSSRDISGRKQAEARLSEALEAARAANLAKSRFLATMSHEIRTPMNGILGMAQLLMQMEVDEAERQDYLRTICSSGQTLLALLDDILDLSKVEAGKFQLESIVFEPRQVIHEVQLLLEETAWRKGLALDFAWEGDESQRFRGDPLRIRQMLSNFISNAIKFTDEGHIQVRARQLAQEETSSTLEFSVADTGIGIAADKLAQLFKPFSQADDSTTRQYGGTGLGLSIVRNLAGLMGGEAGVESEPGRGSRFWFTLRVENVAAGEDTRYAGRPVAGQAARLATPARMSGKALVVEDNQTNRKLVHAMLTKLGLEVDMAEDGQQGVAKATAAVRPDLILMDIQMPIMDGYAATENIRAWEKQNGGTRLPIIALTANAFAEDRRHCISIGMDDFLAKPIDIQELARHVSVWLDKDAARMRPQAEPLAPGAQAAAESEGMTFDAAYMLKTLGGDRALAKIVVRSAVEDIPGYLEAFETARAEGRMKEAERATHTMKGLVAQVGGVRLAKLMRQANDGLKQGNWPEPAAAARLQAEYAELASALQAWLQ